MNLKHFFKLKDEDADLCQQMGKRNPSSLLIYLEEPIAAYLGRLSEEIAMSKSYVINELLKNIFNELPDKTWYLPDFFLKNVGMRTTDPVRPGVWVEIKAQSPTKEEQKKLSDLAQLTKTPAILLFGSIPNIGGFNDDSDSHYEFEEHGGFDNYMVFSKCENCGSVKLDFDNSYWFCHKCNKESCHQYHPDFEKAITAAKQARF